MGSRKSSVSYSPFANISSFVYGLAEYFNKNLTMKKFKNKTATPSMAFSVIRLNLALSCLLIVSASDTLAVDFFQRKCSCLVIFCTQCGHICYVLLFLAVP